MEDRIPGGLQHCYKMCCKKGGLVCFGDDTTTGMQFPDKWTYI